METPNPYIKHAHHLQKCRRWAVIICGYNARLLNKTHENARKRTKTHENARRVLVVKQPGVYYNMKKHRNNGRKTGHETGHDF